MSGKRIVCDKKNTISWLESLDIGSDAIDNAGTFKTEAIVTFNDTHGTENVLRIG